MLEATLQLIDECGPKGFRLTEAARRAGVSSAAPYRHFDDREAMIAAVGLKGTQLLTTAMGQALAQPRIPLVERVCDAGVAYVRFAAQHRAYYRALFGADLDRLRHRELFAAVRDLVAMVTAEIEQAAGRELAVDVDAPRCTAELWVQVHGVAALLADGVFAGTLADRDPEELVRGLLRHHLAQWARPVPPQPRFGPA